MKKYLLILFLIVFIVPSFALASWWNPFSWFKKSTPVIKQELIQQKVDVAPSIQLTPVSIKEKVDKPLIEKVAPKKVINTIPVSSTVIQPQTPPNTILCNGKSWNSCPSGQNFFCPASGDAQCLTNSNNNQTVQQQQPQNSDYLNYLNSLNEQLTKDNNAIDKLQVQEKIIAEYLYGYPLTADEITKLDSDNQKMYYANDKNGLKSKDFDLRTQIEKISQDATSLTHGNYNSIHCTSSTLYGITNTNCH